MSKSKKLLKNTMIIAIGNIATKCVSFFMLPLYTTLLSKDDYGIVDVINTYVLLLVTVLTLQLEQAVFRFLVESRGDDSEQKYYISTTFFCVIIANALFFLLSVIWFSIVNYEYSTYLICTVLLNVVMTVVLQIARGLGDNKIYALGSFIYGSSNVMLNVFFVALLHWKVEGMLLSNIFSLCLTTFFVCLKLRLYKYLSCRYVSKQHWKSMWCYAKPLIPSTLSWWGLNASDRLLINMKLGMGYNGIYSVANKFSSIYSMVSNIFQVSWTESAAENVSVIDRDQYYNKIINQTIRMYSSVCVGVIVVIPFVFNWLIGMEFREAYYYIPISMIGVFFHSVAALFGSMYFAFKETKALSLTTYYALGINLLFNIVFIGKLKLHAATLSTMISCMVIIIYRYYDIRRFVKIQISRKYIRLECVLYIFVGIGYFSENLWLQLVNVIVVIVYCFIQNKELIKSIYNILQKRFNKKIGE